MLLSNHLSEKSCSIVCYFYILTIVILAISHFGFEGGIWVLVASVAGHCILITCTL